MRHLIIGPPSPIKSDVSNFSLIDGSGNKITLKENGKDKTKDDITNQMKLHGKGKWNNDGSISL